jgi:hypothetical protein
MHRDFAAAIRDGRQPSRRLERALDDQGLRDLVYAEVR